MNISVNNFNKPSNKRWKKVADYLLYTGLPSINAFLVAIAVSKFVSPEFSLWAIAISSLLIALFKGFTKFTAEETPNTPADVPENIV